MKNLNVLCSEYVDQCYNRNAGCEIVFNLCIYYILGTITKNEMSKLINYFNI